MKKIYYLLSTLALAINLHAAQPPQSSSASEQEAWNGDHYHKYSQPQVNAAMKHLKNLALEEESSTLVDLCCGPGDITAVIADRAKNSTVLGIDSSGSMIATAERLYGNKPNLRFRVLDVQKLDYQELFDKAFSFSALHWIDDKPAFFKGLFQSLKPNGEFLLTVGTKNPKMENLKKTLFTALLQNPKFTFLAKTPIVTASNAVARDELQAMAQGAGFKDIEIEEETLSHDFATIDELVQFFDGFLCGYKDIAALPEQVRQELTKTGANEWVKLFDGRIAYTWANLVAKGKKPAK